MSARASPRLLLWLFASPTPRVRFATSSLLILRQANHNLPDANAFKDSFIKAQKENESLFGEGSTEAAEKVEEPEAV